MKTSVMIAGVAFGSRALAGAALFIQMCSGGAEMVSYQGWTWDGGLKDDNFPNEDSVPDDDRCFVENGSDGSCDVGDWNFDMVDGDTGGCHNSDDITEAYITTPDGEKVSITEDDRCKEIELCVDSGYGGCDFNGWQCDI